MDPGKREKPMTRPTALGRPAILFLAGAALLLPGCFRHHTIEPGTWRLTIEANDVESKVFARKKPRDVEVTVDWGDGKSYEMVNVQFMTKTDGQTRALRGKIESQESHLDGRKVESHEIHLEGLDPAWILMLSGKVHDPKSVSGTAFARGRLENDMRSFQGTFTMNKVEPGP